MGPLDEEEERALQVAARLTLSAIVDMSASIIRLGFNQDYIRTDVLINPKGEAKLLYRIGIGPISGAEMSRREQMVRAAFEESMLFEVLPDHVGFVFELSDK